MFSDDQIRNLTINQLLHLLIENFAGVIWTAIKIPAGTKLFRIRKMENKPHDIASVGIPPATLITKMGRLNDFHESVGYFSLSRIPTYFEVGAIVGDTLALTRWKTAQTIIAMHIGYNAEYVDKLSSSRTGTEYSFALETRNKNAELYDWLSDLLTDPIKPEEEYKYKATIAIAKKLLYGGPQDALLYPTVAMHGNVDNLGVKEASLEKIKLKSVEWIKVREKKSDTFEVNILDSGTIWNPEGFINWNGRPLHWVLASGAEAKVKAVDGEWIAFDDKGNEIEPS